MNAHLDPALALALLAVPPRAIRALLVMAANAGQNGVVNMNARQLAEGLSTPGDPCSVDTAYRAMHQLDARYGGSGHIIHTGQNPRDNRYEVRPFPSVGANKYVREDMFRKNADSRTVAESGTVADIRTDATESRTGAAKNTGTVAEIRTGAETFRNAADIRPPTPPMVNQNHHQPAARADIVTQIGGTGGGGGELDEKDKALRAAGVSNGKTRNRLAISHTPEEIAAAVKLAKAYGKGGGAVVHELDSGNAAERVAITKAQQSKAAKLATAREVIAAAPTTPAAPDFDHAMHAALCGVTPSATLAEAFGMALQWEYRSALALDRRGINIATVTDAANAGTDEGRAFVLEAVTHKLIRAGVARALEQINTRAPRVVPEVTP